MDIEELAWKAFRLSGSVEAYLLHRRIEMLNKENEEKGWIEQTDL